MSHDAVAARSDAPDAAAVRAYWDTRIHDLEMTKSPVGSLAFFDELDAYRFEKLAYLPRVVDFGGYRARALVEVGCGVGTDLVRFAQGGAKVLGVDLSATAAGLARRNLEVHGCHGHVICADGGHLPIASGTVDVVYAHGVLQYSANPRQIVTEALRVLKSGGEGIFMVYNRVSWLHAMSRIMKVPLEHADAPGLRLYAIDEYRRLLDGFQTCEILPERFPVHSRLHGGWKGALYNGGFVGTFNLLPRSLVSRFGWHLMGLCRK